MDNGNRKEITDELLDNGFRVEPRWRRYPSDRMTFLPNILPYVLLSLVFGIVLALQMLWLIFLREAVKTDLRERICTPIQIRWTPFPSTSIEHPVRTTGFRVLYKDWDGRLHRACCMIRHDWKFGRRKVAWTRDEVLDSEKSA